LTEHELDHVFIGISDDIPVLNAYEVMDWRSVSYDDLEKELKEYPSHFTAWFKQIHQQVNACILEMYNEKTFQKHQTK
jgi:isopentenyl-diphosphate delta-isomerase